eukprot:6016627-Lingulodinium_polyedra.AAC.1
MPRWANNAANRPWRHALDANALLLPASSPVVRGNSKSTSATNAARSSGRGAALGGLLRRALEPDAEIVHVDPGLHRR